MRPLQAFVMLLACALAGCVTSGQISRRAVSYNAAIDAARGEMLLLNVLRARDRRQMVFTGLMRITGSVRTEGRIGATGTLQDPEKAVFGPGATIVDSPTFDIAVLDSQEFTRGIMTPLSFELLEYFWDQGFVREMLFYLATERIDVECASGEAPRALENDPRGPSWAAFRSTLEAIADSGRWEMVDHLTEEVGPPVEPAEALRLPTLVSVANAKLRLARRADGHWQLVRPVERQRLVARGHDVCSTTPSSDVRFAFYETKRALETAPANEPGERRARIVVRSPQAILFYLGEMARPGREVAIRQRDSAQQEVQRLMVVRDADQCPQALVSANFGGKRWVIPDGSGECHPGRSMQSMALAAQLLSLQQSARDLPAAGTVRIIGQ